MSYIQSFDPVWKQQAFLNYYLQCCWFLILGEKERKVLTGAVCRCYFVTIFY